MKNSIILIETHGIDRVIVLPLDPTLVIIPEGIDLNAIRNGIRKCPYISEDHKERIIEVVESMILEKILPSQE